MAKINQGILGGFSGSVANIVGSSWKGIAVMKAKPLSVANPRTALQVAQRAKFKAGSELSTYCKSNIIKPFWDRFAVKMSGVNAWMSENVKNYDSTGLPTLNDLVFSKGNISYQKITVCQYDDTLKQYKIDWDSSLLPSNGLLTDQMAVVVVGEDNEVYAMSDDFSVIRSDDEIVLDELISNPGVTVRNAYLIAKRPDGTIVSDTYTLVVTNV